MVTIRPVRRALVPVDSDAAERISAPNYDEFQGDLEVHGAIRKRPGSVLGVTMAHCAVEGPGEILPQDSPEALELAERNFRELRAGDRTRIVEDALFVYAIDDPDRPHVRQIGLGGMADTGEIRTDDRPGGTVVRNEKIREEKARGRARLVDRTAAFIGTVNLAVEDRDDRFRGALERFTGERPEDHAATDRHGCTHRVWLVEGPAERASLREALEAEPRAYVADGNHRSAAAAMLGLDGYLAVFFPTATMGLAPYNRLVREPRPPLAQVLAALEEHFEVEPLPDARGFQPRETHEIGLYADGDWHRLVPRPGSYDPADAAQAIDADIVQRRFFDAVLGIEDPRDERLTFVGGDRDPAYLEQRVDEGEFGFAVTLPPVTMEQFVEVCRQGRIMPPKSTWFRPKLRMGLVMALVKPLFSDEELP